MIVYALVARGGKTVLAEYTSTAGNFPTVTRVILGKIPEGQDSRMSYVYDRHVFHYVVEDGLIYLCMAEEADKRRITFAFLDDVKKLFNDKYGQAAKNAIAFSLNEGFGPILRQRMEFFNTDPSADKLSQVKAQIDDVRTIMLENIDRVLERGEKMELLVDKTEQLNQQAFRFEKQSRGLRNTMWYRRLRTYVIIFLVVGLIIFFITSMLCGGFTFKNC